MSFSVVFNKCVIRFSKRKKKKKKCRASFILLGYARPVGSSSSFSRMVAWVIENSLPRALGIISCTCLDFNAAASCNLSAGSQIDLMCLQLPLTLNCKEHH
jgi:hypothetical protein